eukprot:COSAG01_NODE_2027_length_8600_cov_3.986356_4_plen_122_part_00
MAKEQTTEQAKATSEAREHANRYRADLQRDAARQGFLLQLGRIKEAPGDAAIAARSVAIAAIEAHRCAKEEKPVLGKATTIATAHVYGDPLQNGMSSSRPAEPAEAAGPAKGAMRHLIAPP